MARILVVDDESIIRIALLEILSDAGYKVSVAEDADEALGLLAKEEYDVIMTDIIMPRITGVALLKAIKEVSPQVQVILMTGEPSVQTASESLRGGAIDYLAKPIGKEQLLKTVANAARIKALNDDRRRLTEENLRHQKNLEHLVGERTAALSESKERYRKLFESSVDAILVLDPKAGYVDCNRAALKLFRVPSKESLLKLNLVALSPEQQPDGSLSAQRVKDFIDRVLKDGSYSFEWMFARVDGTKFPASVSATRLRWGNRVLIQGSIRDITEFKRVEKEKALLEQQFYQAQKLETLGTLAGGIAHDFNNILSPILGYTEMAQELLSGESKAKNYIGQVLVAVHRARELVEQILTFSRPDHQAFHPVQIHKVVKEAVKLLRAWIPSTIEIQTGIDVHCNNVLGDSSQLLQVIMNLCTNAVHAMKESNGVLQVRLASVRAGVSIHPDMEEGDYTCLTVADNGHGIVAANLEKIFTPFFTTKKTSEGTGLGLAVIQGIVNKHGGVLTVESEIDKGTTFRVFFRSVTAKAESREPVTHAPNRGHGTILFVDDEKSITLMMKQILEDFGYRVITKTDPLEALAYFQAQPEEFDLVISDQIMPKMTGSDMIEAMQRIRPKIPVIIISGYIDKLTADQIEKLALAKFLLKPLAPSMLFHSIEQILHPC